MARLAKEKKRQAKKEKEIKLKSDLRQKMSVIATSTGIDNDEELNLNSRLWDELRQKGFEHLDEEVSDVSDSEVDEDADDEQSEEENSDLDDKTLAIEKMAKQFEDNIAEQKEYASRIDRKLAKSELKRKTLIESQR